MQTLVPRTMPHWRWRAPWEPPWIFLGSLGSTLLQGWPVLIWIFGEIWSVAYKKWRGLGLGLWHLNCLTFQHPEKIVAEASIAVLCVWHLPIIPKNVKAMHKTPVWHSLHCTMLIVSPFSCFYSFMSIVFNCYVLFARTYCQLSYIHLFVFVGIGSDPDYCGVCVLLIQRNTSMSYKVAPLIYICCFDHPYLPLTASHL